MNLRNEQISLLMEKLKGLRRQTELRNKPLTEGEPCGHMHVEFWKNDAVFMCSRCHQPVTDPVRIQCETDMMQRLGDEDPSVPEDSARRGVSIAFLLAF